MRHTGSVNGILITPDDNRIISCSNDQTIKLWNFDTGEMTGSFNEHSQGVNTIAVVANLDTGALGRKFEGHKGAINSLALTPEGDRVISASSDSTIKIWDRSTSECIQTLNEHSNEVNTLALTPNGDRIISGSSDATIKIWNTDTGECQQTLTGHSDAINSVALNTSGDRLVSGSKDQTIKIWNVDLGTCLLTINPESAARQYQPRIRYPNYHKTEKVLWQFFGVKKGVLTYLFFSLLHDVSPLSLCFRED